MTLTGENRSTRRKTCPSVTLYTKNPTSTDLGSKTGLCGDRLATNHFSYGTSEARIDNSGVSGASSREF
jgi:hypothetical protein